MSLGANLGDRLDNLRGTKKKIAGVPDVRIIDQAAVYETEPVDVQAEFRDLKFLNSVLIIRCGPPVQDLYRRLHALEAEMGRSHNQRRGMPRVIDIDIIYAEDLRVCTNELKIPHPRWARRRFVVQPLADVRPALIIPGQSQNVTEILLSLPARPKVVLFGEKW